MSMGSLFLGAPAPVFRARSKVNPQFAFSSLGGRWVALGFLSGDAAEADAAAAMLRELPGFFRDDTCVAFLVTPDAAMFEAAADAPPVRWFDDASGELRRMYDAERPTARWRRAG
jgi:hypothetical protein